MTGRSRREGPLLSDLRKFHHQMPRWVIVLLIVGAAAVVAYHVAQLLMMLMVAAVIAYILSWVVGSLERLGIKRSVAVILLFVAVALIVVMTDLFFAPYLKQEMRNIYVSLPAFSKKIEGALLTTAQSSMANNPAIGSMLVKLAERTFGPGGFLERTLNASELLMQATPFIVALILVPFFVFFLLKDWPDVVRKVIDWVPPSYVETTLSVIAEINILIGKYLRGLAADCFFVGLLASLGLWLVGIDYPIMLGILSGVANVIPYLGPIVGCSASCLIALVQFNSFDALLNVVILYIIIKVSDDLLLQPLMIGKSVELHPMLLVITIIVGEKLFGISGMIVGVPLVTIVQKTASILIEHRRESQRRECSMELVHPHIEKTPVRPV